MISVSTGDKKILLIDESSFQVTKTIEVEERFISMCFSPDGSTLLAGGSNFVYIFDVSSGELLNKLAHNGYVLSLSFDSSGTRFVSSSSIGLLKVWDITSMSLLFERNKLGISIPTVCFSPDDKYILCGTVKGKLFLHDSLTFKELFDIYGFEINPLEPQSYNKHSISSCSFDSNVTKMLTSSHDYYVRLIDLNTGDVINQIKFDNPMNSTQFNSDESRILSGSYNTGTSLCNANDLTLIKTISHEGITKSVSYSSDENSIIVLTEFSVLFFDSELNEEIGNIRIDEECFCLAVQKSSTGSYI